MPDSTTLNDYPAGSPEAQEWRAIRDRNVDDLRRRVTADRFGGERAVSIPALREDAGILAALAGEDEQLVASLSASGWLLFPDTSEHQGSFNLQWCKDAGFKIHAYKATEGRTYVDGQQARTRDEIKRLGLIGMVYGFVYWSAEYDNNPSLWNAQGVWFAQHAPAEFAHAIDVEMLCSGKSTDVARVVAGYRSVYPNHPLMIYTNRSLYASRSKGSPADPSTLGLLEWHAGVGNGYYTSATGSLPAEFNATSALSNSLSGFPPDLVWQFTDHGAAAGQLVDGNAFKGTADDFQRVFITGGASDDMSQQDVDTIVGQLKTFITSEVDRIVHDRLANPWVRASGYGADALDKTTGMISPLGMTYQNYLQHRAALSSISALVADDPSLAQIQSAVAASAASTAPALSSAIVEGLRGALPSDVKLDPQQMHDVVAQALDEHLRSLTIVSDAPPLSAGSVEPGEG